MFTEWCCVLAALPGLATDLVVHHHTLAIAAAAATAEKAVTTATAAAAAVALALSGSHDSNLKSSTKYVFQYATHIWLDSLLQQLDLFTNQTI